MSPPLCINGNRNPAAPTARSPAAMPLTLAWPGQDALLMAVSDRTHVPLSGASQASAWPASVIGDGRRGHVQAFHGLTGDLGDEGAGDAWICRIEGVADMHDYSPAGILIAPCPDFLTIAELRTMIMGSSSRIAAKTVHDHEKIPQSGLQGYALLPHVPLSAHAADRRERGGQRRSSHDVGLLRVSSEDFSNRDAG